MNLIYLISSLPMLSLDSEPPLSKDEFLQKCRDWLRAEDCATVASLLNESPSEHPFITALMDKETIVRNTLVELRARASGRDPALYTRYARTCDLKIKSEVQDAVNHAKPLQKERNLDRIRWNIIDELSGVDPLSIRKIFAYAAKLAIVTRWSSRSQEAGQKTFEELSEVPVTL